MARLLKHRYFRRSEFLVCSLGTRPSYAWRSIMHGRELLKEGLVHKLGNGRDTKVWLDNWLLDHGSRPPRYHQDAVVDLTLTVHDLMDVPSRSWNVNLVRQVIAEEDVELVLNTKFNFSRTDSLVWGFSKNERYDSRSGYKLIESLLDFRSGVASTIPPLEKQLWKKLWKTNTSPKLRHFLWRVMSGALAVKAQLHTRGIPLDSTCPVCRQGSETICHMLFHCTKAKEVWSASQFPVPPAGWSLNSVFLNLHYLLSCSQKQEIGLSIRLAFPWILWQIWKARNKICFEQVSISGSETLSRAMEESMVWLNLHGILPESSCDVQLDVGASRSWEKPPFLFLKCNVGSSWSSDAFTSGASWILRDSFGHTRLHSRRSFSGVSSALQGDLLALTWATKAMKDLKFKNVLVEFSSTEAAGALNDPLSRPFAYQACHDILRAVHSLVGSKLLLVPVSNNVAAFEIAYSVTRDHRLQSYVARFGPQWLNSLITMEATQST